ncbi:hypothetical protein G8759_12380 [Spirosoma aureum]|uniref:Uncharacterized protein n=1 Tax=Spirosoma aureum TaxID=2692134 RepID=A0A6G9ALS4_9BACT|nr:hypothetical protein [Spirosoma aureum]QIP13368.1 hypothetical protein G8759_12380 [Spirosoma aureum]
MPGKLSRAGILLYFQPATQTLRAQSVQVLTNQVGYEGSKANKAIVVADRQLTIPNFQLNNTGAGI